MNHHFCFSISDYKTQVQQHSMIISYRTWSHTHSLFTFHPPPSSAPAEDDDHAGDYNYYPLSSFAQCKTSQADRLIKPTNTRGSRGLACPRNHQSPCEAAQSSLELGEPSQVGRRKNHNSPEEEARRSEVRNAKMLGIDQNAFCRTILLCLQGALCPYLWTHTAR